MRVLWCLVMVLSFWAGLDSVAHAQPTRGRGEVSVNVFAVGFARITQEVGGSEVKAKQIALGYPQLRVSGAYGIHDLVMIGAETSLAWRTLKLEGAERASVMSFSLTPTVDLFLVGGGERTQERGARPFVGLAVGLGYESYDDANGDRVRAPQGVFLGRLGVRGFINRMVSLDPLVLIGGQVGTLRGALDGTTRAFVFQAGFALTFWMGDPDPLPF